MDLEEKRKALTNKFIKEFDELEADKIPAIRYFTCGDKFKIGTQKYILAQVLGGKYCLISYSGNREKDPLTLRCGINRFTLVDVQKLADDPVTPV